jgi:hypothetical protein
MSAMLSRRGFLNATLGAGAGSMLAQPAAAQSPAAQSGARRIIVDSQVHNGRPKHPTGRGLPGAWRNCPNHSATTSCCP